MKEKKVLNMEELMIDYGEMTSFDFNSLNYRQMQELQTITESEYLNIPSAFKYGQFDIVDLFQSFISQKS